MASKARTVSVALLTILLAVAVGLQWVLWAEFNLPYTLITAGAFVVLLGFVLAFTRGGPSPAADTATHEEAAASHAPPAQETWAIKPAATPALPTEIVTRPGSPSAEAGLLPTAAPTPPPFTMRGFTLHQRTLKGKTSYVFTTGKVPGGTPVPIPEGYAAVWDKKAKKPRLERIVAETPAPAAPVGLADDAPRPFAQKRCAAMTGFADFCTNPARPGTAYCAKHVNWSPSDLEPKLEVVRDGRRAKTAKGAGRHAKGSIVEVRVAKPQPKTGGLLKRIKTRLVVRGGEDHVTPHGGGSLRLANRIEVRVPRGAAAKPGKKARGTTLEVRQPRGGTKATALPKSRTTLQVKLAGKGAKARGLPKARTRLEVRTPRGKPAGRVGRAATTMDVRMGGKRGGTKPLPKARTTLEVHRDEPGIRVAPLPKRHIELEVRRSKVGSPKPLRVAEPDVVLKPAPRHTPKPLRVDEPRVEVKPASAHAPKPLRVAEPELVVVKDSKKRSVYGVEGGARKSGRAR
jgi:hypothetical protein